MYGENVSDEDNISIYPIKINQTIVFNTNENSVRIMAINNNFENSKIYPLALTNELLIEGDKDILLYQSKSFSTVKIELKEVTEIENSDKDNIVEYNL